MRDGNPTETIHDVVIFCPSAMRTYLVAVFEKIIAEDEKSYWIWNGITRRGRGILILECEERISEALYQELETNIIITDYSIYAVPAYYEGKQERKEETTHDINNII